MKRHSMFAATTLAGALAIATPAVAGGLLGGISGGAGGGVLGTAGGTLSSPATNFGATGVLGATSQFQGQVMQPNLTIQRPALPTVSPNFGAGAGGTLDAAGQLQGEIARPEVAIPRQPLRNATGTVQSVRDHAQSKVGAAREVLNNTSASTAGEASSAISATNRSVQMTGGASNGSSASAGRTSVGAESSAQAGVRAGY